MNNIFKGIVLFGEMGSGKSYIGAMIQKKCDAIILYNIGDICREIMTYASLSLGYCIEDERILGQKIGEKLRELDTNLLNHYVYGKVQKHKNINKDKTYIPLITGGRTRDDFKYWKDKSYLTIGIKSNQIENRTVQRDGISHSQSRNHFTETEVKNMIKDEVFDIMIDNDLSEIEQISNICYILDKHFV